MNSAFVASQLETTEEAKDTDAVEPVKYLRFQPYL